MTRRDLAWRGIGACGLAGAMALGIVAHLRDAPVLGLSAFGLALLCIVLLVQGRRVPAALRIERSKHRALARAIHDLRRQRSGGQ